MAKQHPQKMVPRWRVVRELAGIFVKDYKEMLVYYPLEQQIEITEHLQGLIEISELNHGDPAWYKNLQRSENALLKKYGKALKPYKEKQFHKYFDWAGPDWSERIYTAEEFNRLPTAEQSLTRDDFDHFLKSIGNSLYHEHTLLSLQEEPGFSIANPVVTKTGESADLVDKNITKARQLLLVYYFLKALGIEHRDTSSVSAVARFIHVLTGTRFTSIQNSEIYKKYRKMPNYNEGESLIADLRFIRPYFEDMGLTASVKEIDMEINRAISDLPYGARKKYRNL